MLVTALLLHLAQPVSPTAAPPPPPPGDTVAFDPAADRMTVQVHVGDHGPFPFVVDTGAERTVVSEELARDLRLPAAGIVRLYSTTGLSDVSTVRLPELGIGRRRVSGIAAVTLRRSHLGADGLIGVDSLQHSQVRFDFLNRRLTILPAGTPQARSYVGASNDIVVTARSRLGRLIVTDARIDGERVTVVIDTGAETSIGNAALRQRLDRRHGVRQPRSVVLLDVTGGTLPAEYAGTSRLRIGNVTIDRLSVAFANSPVFTRLGLDNRPALLLGMDALQVFEGIAIDFARRRVTFRQSVSEGGAPVRMATGGESPARSPRAALR